MKALKELDDLICDLDLLGLADLAKRAQAVKLMITPKPKVVKTAKVGQRIKLEILENGKVFEAIFDNEAKAEAFLKLKHKQRVANHKYPEGYSFAPILIGYRKDQIEAYQSECAEYWQAAKEQNLDFHVKIIKL